MQHSPAPSGHGGHRYLSRRKALTYGLSAPAVLALGSVLAALATQEATAANIRLIDFTHRQVPPDQIRSAGFDGALVYVSELRPGADFDFKPVTRGYADALRAAGLHVVSCYQYGKPGWPTPSDYTRGYDGGAADAQTALRLHAAAGGPASAPIFFSIDEDIDFDTWKSVAVQWLRGVNSVLGVHRTGVYGHARACAWAIADGVIGRSTTPGHWWAWQTKAWSGGQRDPRAVLYQSVVVTASEPGVAMGGTHVDVDEVLAADFGQWALDRSR
ncbi:DUF1906 domain-containing protein [Mycolicibacterium pyrenivorans]|uniref:DUF1906 domain-containing protein n=1 Tax=Mycolicibacterium pyrenivorans TaxID=187102 RepID=UPI003556538A|nr:DUF1906 domain-containing protein [Mycolicibacterium pyrenivorans]